MNREEILKELKVLDDMGIRKEEFIIVYGAALVLNGMKDETRDIDITCNMPTFERIESMGYISSPYRNGRMISITDNIDFFIGNMMVEPIVNLINGYQVQTIQSVYKEKKLRGREKDLEDVKQIDEFLSRMDGGFVTMRISNINIRKIDSDNEPMRNCILCDCVSSSCDCYVMYELTSNSFRANSVKEKPRVYLCLNCIRDIGELMI